jgi:hypothetical protein
MNINPETWLKVETSKTSLNLHPLKKLNGEGKKKKATFIQINMPEGGVSKSA